MRWRVPTRVMLSGALVGILIVTVVAVVFRDELLRLVVRCGGLITAVAAVVGYRTITSPRQAELRRATLHTITETQDRILKRAHIVASVQTLGWVVMGVGGLWMFFWPLPWPARPEPTRAPRIDVQDPTWSPTGGSMPSRAPRMPTSAQKRTPVVEGSWLVRTVPPPVTISPWK